MMLKTKKKNRNENIKQKRPNQLSVYFYKFVTCC